MVLKGMSLIAGVLFMAIVITAVSVAYMIGYPVIQEMSCAAHVEKMRTAFSEIDSVVQEVASDAPGSRRTVEINVDRGKIYLQNRTIYWKHECPEGTFSPNLLQSMGNVLFGTGMDADCYRGECEGEDAYIMENSHIRACFRDIGSYPSAEDFNISGIFISMYQKDLETGFPGYIDFIFGDSNLSKTGQGYTFLEREGYGLPYCTLMSYMESDYNINYTINFTLSSGADFMLIEGYQ